MIHRVHLFSLRLIVIRSWVIVFGMFCVLAATPARAAEVIPAVPARYFNDYANVVSPTDADQFNQQLLQFERDTSNQVVVVVYPKMQSDSDIADYTFRVKETWHVGQKAKDNGVVLFVFIQDHQLFIQVNYGLEGALPDATCKQIIDQEITPRFKTGDYTGGLRAGINAILTATKGEYKGTGTTVGTSTPNGSYTNLGYFVAAILGGFFLLGFLVISINRSGGTFYQKHVQTLSFMENTFLFILRMGFYMLLFGRGSSNGGNSRNSGGFSGGGGTGGGGGAGGRW